MEPHQRPSPNRHMYGAPGAELDPRFTGAAVRCWIKTREPHLARDKVRAILNPQIPTFLRDSSDPLAAADGRRRCRLRGTQPRLPPRASQRRISAHSGSSNVPPETVSGAATLGIIPSDYAPFQGRTAAGNFNQKPIFARRISPAACRLLPRGARPGLRSKNPYGTSATLCQTVSMTGQSSGRGRWWKPIVYHSTMSAFSTGRRRAA